MNTGDLAPDYPWGKQVSAKACEPCLTEKGMTERGIIAAREIAALLCHAREIMDITITQPTIFKYGNNTLIEVVPDGHHKHIYRELRSQER